MTKSADINSSFSGQITCMCVCMCALNWSTWEQSYISTTTVIQFDKIHTYTAMIIISWPTPCLTNSRNLSKEKLPMNEIEWITMETKVYRRLGSVYLLFWVITWLFSSIQIDFFWDSPFTPPFPGNIGQSSRITFLSYITHAWTISLLSPVHITMLLCEKK